MKPKTKILFLLSGLILPYIGLVMYRALTHPENPFFPMVPVRRTSLLYWGRNHQREMLSTTRTAIGIVLFRRPAYRLTSR